MLRASGLVRLDRIFFKGNRNHEKIHKIGNKDFALENI